MKHEQAPADSDEAIVVECDLEEPPEKVWQALTTPEIVAEWLMPNDMRAGVGARFSFNPAHASAQTRGENTAGRLLASDETTKSAQEPRKVPAAPPRLRKRDKTMPRESHASEASERTIKCEVLESKPPRLLSYKWREEPGTEEGDGRALESVVTFVLTGRSDGGTHLRVVHDEFELTTLEPTAMNTVTFWPRYAPRRRPLRSRRKPVAARPYCAIHSRARRAA